MKKFTNPTYTAKAQEERVEEAGAGIAVNITETAPADVPQSVSSYFKEKDETRSVRINGLITKTTKERLQAATKKTGQSMNELINAAVLRLLDDLEK